ncbi:hypothetical protein MVEN_01638100 [Mycena venus]|uniref:Uncharacterized protein n=1 Tax=Mycena venus TaxID=2733690 RepID=A0A8H7CQR3_9AGAR|nr:hypothetical protein MVEN_01638100 [Mycena venus]
MSDAKGHVPSPFDSHMRDLVLGILIPGIVLSAIVLMAFAYTASQLRSRPHLHRVSFRLLVYAMVSNFILSVTLIPTEMIITGPKSGTGCAFAAFFSLMRWLVGAQSFWILFMALSELVCFVILASYMIHHRISVKRMWSDVSAKMTASESQHAAYTVAPVLKFRGIILRITLYPLLSCALNFSNIILDLCFAQRLSDTESTFRLSVLDICVVNGRPFLYAVLAATDPSFIRAVSALRQPPIVRPSSKEHNATSQLQSQSWCSTTPSSAMLTQADGNKAEGDGASRGRQLGDAAERPQQTEADVHHGRTHRDPEQGIAPNSSVVHSGKDSIEFQI